MDRSVTDRRCAPRLGAGGPDARENSMSGAEDTEQMSRSQMCDG